MTFLSLLKDPVVTAILGAMVGVLLKHILDLSKQSQRTQEHAQRTRLDVVEEQLQEFYLPLYTGLVLDKAVWDLRDIAEERTPTEQQDTQEAIETEILLPNHQDMIDIVREQLHHAGSPKIVACVEDYLRHIATLEALRAADVQEPPSAHGAPWPSAFEKEIRQRTQELLQEYNQLLRELQLRG